MPDNAGELARTERTTLVREAVPPDHAVTLHQLQSAIAQLEVVDIELRMALAQRDEALAVRARLIEQRDTARKERDEALAETTALRAQLASAVAEYTAAHAAAETLRELTGIVMASTSWRLTEPLRRFGSALRRLARPRRGGTPS